MSIKAINKSSIHRICSGQVILDLATAVKELIENSLDAEATDIEIRLKECGAELIEVADNGLGISPDNYQALTQKYWTSKISDFQDLQDLGTFGFRGEALSSLCALGEVTVTTRTAEQEVGVHLSYDRNGTLLSQTPAPRAVGTTVAVRELFKPLPVRYRAFRQNLSREFARLQAVLHAYALIATRARIIASNQKGRGSRTVIVCTKASDSLRANLIAVFGTKAVALMQPLEAETEQGCRISGWVSKAATGCGRVGADRQFFYLNGRPVDVPKAVKVLNEVYRTLSSPAAGSGSKPMAVIDLQLPRQDYDVNVTPDKRTVFLHYEADLLAALRQALHQLWEPARFTYTLQPRAGSLASQDAVTTPSQRGQTPELDASQPAKRPRTDAGSPGSCSAGSQQTPTPPPALQQATPGSSSVCGDADRMSTPASAGLDHRAGEDGGRAVLPLADLAFAGARARATTAGSQEAAQKTPSVRMLTPPETPQPPPSAAAAAADSDQPAQRTPHAPAASQRASKHRHYLPESTGDGGSLGEHLTPEAAAAGREAGGGRAGRAATPSAAAPDLSQFARGGRSQAAGGKGARRGPPAEAGGAAGASSLPGRSEQPSLLRMGFTPLAKPAVGSGPEPQHSDERSAQPAPSSSAEEGAEVFVGSSGAAADGNARDAPPLAQASPGDEPRSECRASQDADSGDWMQILVSQASDCRTRRLEQLRQKEVQREQHRQQHSAAAAEPYLAEDAGNVSGSTPAAGRPQPGGAASTALLWLEPPPVAPYQASAHPSEALAAANHRGPLADLNGQAGVPAAAAGKPPLEAGGVEDGFVQEPSGAARDGDAAEAAAAPDGDEGAEPMEVEEDAAVGGMGQDDSQGAGNAAAEGSGNAPRWAQPPWQTRGPGALYGSVAMEELRARWRYRTQAGQAFPAHAGGRSRKLPLPAQQAPREGGSEGAGQQAASETAGRGNTFLGHAYGRDATPQAERSPAVPSGPAGGPSAVEQHVPPIQPAAAPVSGAGGRFAAAGLASGGDEAAQHAAAAELELQFRKADFKHMVVCGQFNLGFIIARLRDDLWIVDQHASDEKHNFERLQATTVLSRQPLLQPVDLELGAAEQLLLEEHAEVFRCNGFGFKADDADAGRWRLAAVPFSRNVTFGVQDVRELLDLLQAGSTVGMAIGSRTAPGKDITRSVVRPSRVRAMLAMRACRGSIMIGRPLHSAQMSRILDHLAVLDQPWQCPHGRPTMRHLTTLL